MPATIKIKNSSTAGAAPTSGDLVQGELAVNVTDKRLYTENSGGTIVELGTNPSIPVTFPDGSASAPSLTNAGDTNTGMFFPAADTIAFAEGGTETMRLDSAGNMGLGVTPSAWSTGGGVAIQTPAGSLWNYSTSQVNLAQNYYFDGTNYKYKNTGVASSFDQASGSFFWKTAASGTAGNSISFTQAMTLDASGNLLVGKTSSSLTSVGYEFDVNYGSVSGNSVGYIGTSQSSNSATPFIIYSTGAGANRFYVGAGGTVYATSTTISAISDIRFKENVRDLDAGLAEVMALKPRLYDWKEGKGADIKNARGFIAQEFEEVFPDLIDEWRDPAPEGEEPYKSVRADLIPVLVKAIQELKAEVDSLKAQIAGA